MLKNVINLLEAKIISKVNFHSKFESLVPLIAPNFVKSKSKIFTKSISKIGNQLKKFQR